MRFDDSLDTVLAAEMAGPAGIQATWRQAVDLIGRRRARADAGQAAIARLRAIRHDVPAAVRAASARGLARANPPASLVALFADDDTDVAAPVIRNARLTAGEWVALLPSMQPATRGVLRHRRDLSDTVLRALEAFGPSDFALPPAGPMAGGSPPPAPMAETPALSWPPVAPPPAAETATAWLPEAVEAPLLPEVEPPTAIWPPALALEETAHLETRAEPTPDTPGEPAFVAPEQTPFVALGEVARDLPVVVEAIRLERDAPPAPAPTDSDFEIAHIVARIEAHQRLAEVSRAADPAPVVPDVVPDRFRFETDAHGVLRWCDHPARGPLIGLSLAAGRDGAAVAADGSAGGALARRARFADARLSVPGHSPAAGAWRISAAPVFDHDTGRFTGFRGTARRPRPDEEPRVARATPATDALRQLVHELRTPANAISGFAEMIEHELLGPVPPAYREQATAIRTQTGGLLGAIDDIDTAARIESHSLDLRSAAVPLQPLLTRVLADLRPLTDLRGAGVQLEFAPDVVANGDPVVIERLFARLLTALIANTGHGERVTGAVTQEADTIRCDLSRPASLTVADSALFSADAETEATAAGEPLLGSGFAFRLARKLIAESGGSLMIGAESLTVRLPAAVNAGVEQATV